MSVEDEEAAEEWAEQDWSSYWRPYENDPSKQSGYIDADPIAAKSFLTGAAHGRKAERLEIFRRLEAKLLMPDPKSTTQFEPHIVLTSLELNRLIFGGEGEKDKE